MRTSSLHLHADLITHISHAAAFSSSSTAPFRNKRLQEYPHAQLDKAADSTTSLLQKIQSYIFLNPLFLYLLDLVVSCQSWGSSDFSRESRTCFLLVNVGLEQMIEFRAGFSVSISDSLRLRSNVIGWQTELNRVGSAKFDA